MIRPKCWLLSYLLSRFYLRSASAERCDVYNGICDWASASNAC
jgi:hypothetical protein